jgi:hypothetical protein
MLAEGHGLILSGFNTDSCYRKRPPSPVQFLSIPHGQQPGGASMEPGSIQIAESKGRTYSQSARYGPKR